MELKFQRFDFNDFGRFCCDTVLWNYDFFEDTIGQIRLEENVPKVDRCISTITATTL